VRLPALLERCLAERMPAVAIVDRANLFDALTFSQSAAKAGVQPVVGCLLPVRTDEQPGPNGRAASPAWLPVLVQNAAGYRNLLRLLGTAYLGGEARAAPELTLDQLEAATDGLIALTGGPDGPVGRALLQGNHGLGKALLERLATAFPGRLYVELMRHGRAAE
jgi:DNA polymerase-3 subunit alpha